MIWLALGVVPVVAGYVLSRLSNRALVRENEKLKRERDAYIEAVNRSPYPVDVDAILSEWQR